MGRFGDSRFGGHMFGGGTAMGRTATTHSGRLAADSARAGVVLSRSDSVHMRRAVAASERAVALVRGSGSFSGPFEVEAERVASYDREADNWMKRVTIGSDSAVPNWLVDGLQIMELEDEVRDPEVLELTLRAPDDHFQDRIEPLKDEEGAVDIVVMSDGSFDSFDRAAGGNTYELVPPDDREPPREVGDYHVKKFSADIVDEQARIREVEIKFVADGAREPSGDAPDHTAGEDEWHFDFHSGSVATRRVKAEVTKDGGGGEAKTELELVLTAEEALAVEESASYIHAVTINEVDDGSDFAEDSSPGARQTVAITPPDGGGGIVERGDYAVSDWETTWMNEDFVTVELEVTQI